MYTNCALTVKQLFYKPEEGEVVRGRWEKVDGVVGGGEWGVGAAGGAAFYMTFMDGLC